MGLTMEDSYGSNNGGQLWVLTMEDSYGSNNGGQLWV